MDAGILPVKRLDRAKQRLAGIFDDRQRADLARALLEDALELCESTPFLEWWVVTDDPEVSRLVSDRGLICMLDHGTGLNDALELAIDVVAPGARSVTIIPCDVPLAWSGDLQDILDTGATSDLVVVPSGDGGTNGLYLSPPDLIPPRFGDGSFLAHIAQAEAIGKRCSILALPRLELDIDTIEDVDAYLARPKHGSNATTTVLSRLRPKEKRP